MLKLVGTELKQRVVALRLEIAGDAATASLRGLGVADGLPGGEVLDAGARAMARHLAVRAASIYSGSSEMQRDVIARRLLA